MILYFFQVEKLISLFVSMKIFQLSLFYFLLQVKEGSERYLSSTAIVISEIFKLFVCFAVLAYPNRLPEQGLGGGVNGGLRGLLHTLRVEVYGKPIETCKLLVPAGE